MKTVEDGKSAFYKGILENPYPKDTDRHRDWQFGWDRGYFENLSRLADAHSKKTC